MKTSMNHLNHFTDLITKSHHIGNISSLILGGSLATDSTIKANDIDLLLICNDDFSENIYKQIQNFDKVEGFQKYLFDIKLIEVKHIKFINSSTDAPFFFHFVKSSNLLYGQDIRASFKLNTTWFYNTIIRYIEKIEEVKELFYNWQQKSLARISLFEVAKKLSILYEMLSKESEAKFLSSQEHLDIIYGKDLQNIRKLMSKNRPWISLYKERGKENKLSFEVLKVKKKIKQQKEIAIDAQFENIMEKVKELGNICIEILDM
ncbi:MAG: nucleotidyltransferase domain-containing protein [Candidatus Heimdallarchaeota archaeon]|nr:nucleotidyltransferase domain-containing protein [Candidatus Heimdallarchaeota archaeon]MCK4954050.1 nucleotidyltransferase domain-containing protein [Candidatus Heimdallarchaeota archaeon]